MAQAAHLMTQWLLKRREFFAIWQHTASLLMQAHSSGTRVDLHYATGQVRLPLDAEGWAE